MPTTEAPIEPDPSVEPVPTETDLPDDDDSDLVPDVQMTPEEMDEMAEEAALLDEQEAEARRMATEAMPDVPIDPPDPAEKAARRKRSNRKITYACSVCGRDVGRENLKVKRVQFKEMGVHGRIEKSRTVAWLCVIPNGRKKSCLELDPGWGAPSLAAAPGMADTRLARDQ